MITVLGYVIILIMTVLVYMAAKKSGRPALLWGFSNVGIGIVIQIVAPLLIMKLIASSLTEPGSSRLSVDGVEKLKTYANYAGIASVLLSLVAMFIVRQFASRRG